MQFKAKCTEVENKEDYYDLEITTYKEKLTGRWERSGDQTPDRDTRQFHKRGAMRFILNYQGKNVNEEVGAYDTIKIAMDEAKWWGFKSYTIFDSLENREVFSYGQQQNKGK